MVRSLSRAILSDRVTRRKWLAGMAFLMLILFAIGMWVIPGWLAHPPIRFAVWWMGVALWTMVVLLFSFYDAIAAMREEHDKIKRGVQARKKVKSDE